MNKWLIYGGLTLCRLIFFAAFDKIAELTGNKKSPTGLVTESVKEKELVSISAEKIVKINSHIEIRVTLLLWELYVQAYDFATGSLFSAS